MSPSAAMTRLLRLRALRRRTGSLSVGMFSAAFAAKIDGSPFGVFFVT